MNVFQERLISSRHSEPFHFTIKPVLGGVGRPGASGGLGGGKPPLPGTSASFTTVGRLPDSNTEKKTREPLAFLASARGCLPKISIVCGGDAGFAASKTLICPRPRWSIDVPVNREPPPETQTNAISRFDPAKIMSVGSSPTSIVRTTFAVARSTMLIESDSQLATQTSLLFLTAILEGSRPTGISPTSLGATPVWS